MYQSRPSLPPDTTHKQERSAQVSKPIIAHKASRAEVSRFNSKTKFGNGDEKCLVWTGRKGRGGYGRFELDSGVTIAVHRFVWQYVMGREIPEGMQIDHVCHGKAVEAGTCAGAGDEGCRHRLCCNPDHLEMVSASENTRRQDHAGRRKTHCPLDHEYTPDNTFIRNGKRVCKTCERARDRRRRQSA